MNERIKELALKSGLHSAKAGRCQTCTVETKTRVLLATVPGTHAEIADPDVQLHKFAELIVKECVETLGTYEDSWTHQQQMELLKKHFGVEE